jgi:uncharacterized membrane protein YgcG
MSALTSAIDLVSHGIANFVHEYNSFTRDSKKSLVQQRALQSHKKGKHPAACPSLLLPFILAVIFWCFFFFGFIFMNFVCIRAAEFM